MRFALTLIVLMGCGSSSTPSSTSSNDVATDEPSDAASSNTNDSASPTDTSGSGNEGDVLSADAVSVDNSTGAADTASEPPGPDSTVTIFDATPVYFVGGDDRRNVEVQSELPEVGDYASITLLLTLSCPAGGCDPWDRRASFGLVSAKGEAGAPDTVIELARFITPFGVGMSGETDLTDLRPLLKGSVTFRAFIDTWVGPGSPYGDGWLLTAQLVFKGGVPPRRPIAVLPVFTERSVVYGDPKRPTSSFAPLTTMPIPAGAKHLALRSFITGHGQGNLDNCAEFCPREHTFVAGDERITQLVWRDDCATAAAPNQKGTFQYSRGGWCPGAMVDPWWAVLPKPSTDLDSLPIAYEIEAFENSCRPDAPTCKGCSLGTGCDYDGGAHTEPFFQLSTLLVIY